MAGPGPSRGASWGENETKTLIAVWGDEKIQAELGGRMRTKQVFEKIGQRMKSKKYGRDTEQCKTKIKNLKKAYMNVKDNNSKSGNNKVTCPFFEELDAVLGHRPASAPPLILDASAGGIFVELSEERNDDRGNGKVHLGNFFGIAQPPFSLSLLVLGFQMKKHNLKVRRLTCMYVVSNR